MDSTDLLLLCAALAEQGFCRSGERLVARHGTVWLSRPMLDVCGIEGLRIEAKRRLQRIRRQRHCFQHAYDWQCAIADSEALVVALERVCESREVQVLAEAS